MPRITPTVTEYQALLDRIAALEAGADALKSYPGTRPSSANVTYGDGKLRHYLATSSMTTGKTSPDAHIIHSSWDWGSSSSGWEAQLAIAHDDCLYVRHQKGDSTWSSWRKI